MTIVKIVNNAPLDNIATDRLNESVWKINVIVHNRNHGEYEL